MWNNLLLLLGCILVDCHVINGCQLPTEDDPISMCAFCSDSHAGVKWTVHESNRRKYPFGAYSLDISFQCSSSQGTITNDVCFHGDLIPGLVFITNPTIWHWHILGQNLIEGTECTFTANVKDGFARNFAEMTASCSINDESKSLIVPAKCSKSVQEQGCPCFCSEGFTTDNLVDGILTCKNVNECSEEAHQCIDANNCVDTEGSYYCANEPTLTTGPETTLILEPHAEVTSTATQISAASAKTVMPTSTVLTIQPIIGNPIPTSDFTATLTTDTRPLCTTTTSVITTCTITTSATVCCFG